MEGELKEKKDPEDNNTRDQDDNDDGELGNEDYRNEHAGSNQAESRTPYIRHKESLFGRSRNSSGPRSPSSMYREKGHKKTNLRLRTAVELKSEIESYRKKFGKFDNAYHHSLAFYFISHFFKARRLSSCFDFINRVDVYKSLQVPTRKAADHALASLRHIALIQSTSQDLKDVDADDEAKGGADGEEDSSSNSLPIKACMRKLRQDPPPRDAFDQCYSRVKEVLESFYKPFLRSRQFLRFVQILDYSKRKSKMQRRDLKPVARLGRGAFGRVTAVVKKDTQAIYAMKEIPKDVLRKQKTGWMCLNEMQLLSRTNSPFVLSLKYSFHSDRAVHLVFEMCMGGDLRQYLEVSPFDLDRSVFYAAEILLGVDHIHSLEYAYRDLKPSNILLTHTGHCKISDLGLVVKLPKPPKVLKHVAGTPGYWPPEICGRTGTYPVSDYWSWGVLIYAMLTGKRIKDPLEEKRPKKENGEKSTFRGWSPFSGSPNEQLPARKDKKMEHVDVTVSYPPSFTPETKDLLEKIDGITAMVIDLCWRTKFIGILPFPRRALRHLASFVYQTSSHIRYSSSASFF
mmetsp:Transcript_41154/g.66183  ORF Transcript_41154/g.66183 Transcript_41154/m.66183 type:complete len:570 (-) Transcript_41154:37-1746(-)